MSKNSCIAYPEAPKGGASKVYKELLERLKDRPLVNYFYAAYKSNNVADKMDQAKNADGSQKYVRNEQGEHEAKDILEFLDYKSLDDELINNNLAQMELTLGATDVNGNRVDFANAEDALKKADDFNDHHKAYKAIVIQHGDIYNIMVSEMNSRTNTYGDTVKDYLHTWDVYKQVFNNVGVDITQMPQELQDTFNALNTGLAQQLRNLQIISPQSIYRKDALILFYLNQNSQHTQNIVKEFGSIEDAAQALNDFNQGNINLTKPQQTLLLRAIKDAQKFHGIDLVSLVQQVRQNSNNLYANSEEQNIKSTLKTLNKKYGIDKIELHKTKDRIDTLSDAAQEAVINLQRQIRELQRMKGNNVEGRRLERILNSLMKELANKRYYSGILKFLTEASTHITEIDNMLLSIPQTGTNLEQAFGTAKILTDIHQLSEQYYPLVSALADESLIIDENISKKDIDNIRNTAKKLKDFFDKKEKVLNEQTEGTMIKLLSNLLHSNTTPDGMSIKNVVRMAAVDSKKWDWLYSVGRANNPIIGAMGSVIRNAQDSRDAQINEISFRVRVANNKLRKAGYTSEFMYEDETHIASDIDWAAYDSDRKTYIKSLYARGLKGFDLKQAIEDWEEQHTEDRVVDNTNGRTERVPSAFYRKTVDFQKDWSPEQKEYYDTMMQLKGEVGSMLPTYAQRQYFPPQIRRNFLDALGDSKSLKDVGKAFKNKIQNFYKVREDDTDFNKNGIIGGEEYGIVDSDYDNTPLRQIPIFYVNKVEEGELLKDFSTGITALASTAINYAAMDNIADVVEFMGNFAKSQKPRDKNAKADMVQNGVVAVFRDLYNRASNSNTKAIVDGFIAQHIYGQRTDDTLPPYLTKALNNLVAYTSFKGLATNFKGAVANGIMGECQMMIEAGCGEFYGVGDYLWAHTKLFGNAGVKGDMMELLTNNISHKSALMRELFDPLQENFEQKGHTRYYNSAFRQLLSHDLSFIGYSSGEYLIHYVNMYAILHNKKNDVYLNGKRIHLYEAFEVTDVKDGNAKLVLKQGLTDQKGNPLTDINGKFIQQIRRNIRLCNQNCHGSMNLEDKGILYQKWYGRLVMNFRQWMVEHYSRRWRGAHFDATLGTVREGYWYTFFHEGYKKRAKDAWENDHQAKAIGLLMKDLLTFTFRSEAQWGNLSEMQKYNIKRVRAEVILLVCLSSLSFALGEPEDHKKEFLRRFFMYQARRAMVDTEASMPNPKMISSFLTILQSPMASVNTFNSFLYAIYGVYNGDLFSEVKSGDFKGWNKYVRNMTKYNLPFFKDWEQLQKMDTDDSIFKVFDDTPSNH